MIEGKIHDTSELSTSQVFGDSVIATLTSSSLSESHILGLNQKCSVYIGALTFRPLMINNKYAH
jgi:hypothetical protein